MLQHTVHALQSELDNLRADNIKLYEKIKFLQSYPGRVSVQLSVCLSVCPCSGSIPRHRSCTFPRCSLHAAGVGKGAVLCAEEQRPNLPARKALWNCAQGSLTYSKPEARIYSLTELPQPL